MREWSARIWTNVLLLAIVGQLFALNLNLRRLTDVLKVLK